MLRNRIRRFTNGIQRIIHNNKTAKPIEIEILKQTYIYDGTGHFPEFLAKDAVKDRDYTISGCSAPQTEIGHYTTTIQGINNRCGTQITPNPEEPDKPPLPDQNN